MLGCVFVIVFRVLLPGSHTKEGTESWHSLEPITLAGSWAWMTNSTLAVVRSPGDPAGPDSHQILRVRSCPAVTIGGGWKIFTLLERNKRPSHWYILFSSGL